MRRLYKEELEALDQEFIAYLIMQGIDSVKWKEIKASQQERAETLIDEFSNHYFNTFLPTIDFVTLNTTSSLHTINIRTNSAAEFLWSNENSKLGYKEERFKEARNRFIFDLLEKGYKPDKGENFKELAMIFARSKKG